MQNILSYHIKHHEPLIFPFGYYFDQVLTITNSMDKFQLRLHNEVILVIIQAQSENKVE